MTTDPNPVPDPLDPVPADTRDPRGRVTITRDQPGSVTWTVYDSETRDRPGSVTWTVYDSDGRAVERGTGTPPDEPHIVG